MSFDEEPDAPLHGECLHEIEQLRARNVALYGQVERLSRRVVDLLRDRDYMAINGAMEAERKARADIVGMLRRMKDNSSEGYVPPIWPTLPEIFEGIAALIESKAT